MSNEIVKVDTGTQAVVVAQQMSVKDICDRVNLVHQVMDKVMKNGVHYGTVPGCGNKKVLLKPGADVLAMTFKLVPSFDVQRTELGNGHCEFSITCKMHAATGELLGCGVGFGSTLERKYRYRKDSKGNKIENEDIADVINTVLKMAKKRAHVDATLTVTGASDMFTQDMIETEDEEQRAEVKMPKEKSKPVTAEPTPEPTTAEPVEDKPNQEPEEQYEDDRTVTGIIDKVAKKEYTSGTNYRCLVLDTWYSTFDKEIGEYAEGLKGRNVRIKFEFDKSGKYRNIKTIDEVK